MGLINQLEQTFRRASVRRKVDLNIGPINIDGLGSRGIFFVAKFPREQDFKLVPQTPFIGSPGLRGLGFCQRFYPHLHDCNGYFIAKLQRAN